MARGASAQAEMADIGEPEGRKGLDEGYQPCYTARSSSPAHPASRTSSGDAQVGDAEAGAKRGGTSARAGGAMYG